MPINILYASKLYIVDCKPGHSKDQVILFYHSPLNKLDRLCNQHRSLNESLLTEYYKCVRKIASYPLFPSINSSTVSARGLLPLIENAHMGHMAASMGVHNSIKFVQAISPDTFIP
jgi:hypothetical protein